VADTPSLSTPPHPYPRSLSQKESSSAGRHGALTLKAAQRPRIKNVSGLTRGSGCAYPKLRNLIINARIGKVKAGDDNGREGRDPAVRFTRPASANGELILTVLGAIADFKAAEKYKGRKPTALNQADQVQALAAEGVNKVEIAHGLPQPFVKHDLVCSRIRSVPFWA
jgi:hypothetical protein